MYFNALLWKIYFYIFDDSKFHFINSVKCANLVSVSDNNRKNDLLVFYIEVAMAF